MSKLSINLSLVETNDKISRDILSALLPDIQAFFNKKIKVVEDSIADILINSIMSEPEYASLVSGTLLHEFGIPNAASRLSEILNAIRSGKSTEINSPAISGSRIKGGFRLKMVKQDFSDLLSLGGASFTTEQGSILNWLRWLLIEGDSVIITDYSYSVDGPGKSRTGLGVMVSGGSWRVPPEFAGNIKNNWITRAIDKAMPQIEASVTRIMRG
jgi:hypothetical protein